jgi:hypothetical protein
MSECFFRRALTAPGRRCGDLRPAPGAGGRFLREGGPGPAACEAVQRGPRPFLAGGPRRIRVATNVFTQPTELNVLFDALELGLRR